MFEGGFLLCAALATVVIADVRQFHVGPLGRILSLAPLQWIGRISYGIYLWHWPVIVYMTAGRTGLSQPWLDISRVGLTVGLASASYYLIELPIRRRSFPGWARWTVAPASAVALAAVILAATVPAIAAPAPRAQTTAPVPVTVPPSSTVAKSAHAARPKPAPDGAADLVPGAGGFGSQQSIALPKGRVISKKHPLRILVIGDSIIGGAAPGLNAALGSTGDVTVLDNAFDGFGLSTDWGWRTGLPYLVTQDHPDLIFAGWSWDQNCDALPQSHHGPCALQDPAAYKRELEQAVRLMLGVHGVAGVIFLQFPTGVPPNPGAKGAVPGVTAWTKVAESLPSALPGKVMYLPVGSSLLWHGRFTSWLPPAGHPKAALSQWIRVRMIDGVHMCPAGVVWYADAVLADMTAIFHLPAARGRWWLGNWTHEPQYNDPPGACPDDHPPGG
jgi:hypothetical protein